MTPEEIGRVAVAVHALRPDWPAESLRTFISNRETRSGIRIADKSMRDVMLALTWVALDRRTQVPTRLLEGGEWWLLDKLDKSTEQPRPYEREPIDPAPPER
ncbi:MAG: hypothetical protein M0Z51_07515, partial [Propionibacterium sp.]|nr:hypothetical protein [Propionibacterium sp.]